MKNAAKMPEELTNYLDFATLLTEIEPILATLPDDQRQKFENIIRLLRESNQLNNQTSAAEKETLADAELMAEFENFQKEFPQESALASFLIDQKGGFDSAKQLFQSEVRNFYARQNLEENLKELKEILKEALGNRIAASDEEKSDEKYQNALSIIAESIIAKSLENLTTSETSQNLDPETLTGNINQEINKFFEEINRPASEKQSGTYFERLFKPAADLASYAFSQMSKSITPSRMAAAIATLAPAFAPTASAMPLGSVAANAAALARRTGSSVSTSGFSSLPATTTASLIVAGQGLKTNFLSNRFDSSQQRRNAGQIGQLLQTTEIIDLSSRLGWLRYNEDGTSILGFFRAKEDFGIKERIDFSDTSFPNLRDAMNTTSTANNIDSFFLDADGNPMSVISSLDQNRNKQFKFFLGDESYIASGPIPETINKNNSPIEIFSAKIGSQQRNFLLVKNNRNIEIYDLEFKNTDNEKTVSIKLAQKSTCDILINNKDYIFAASKLYGDTVCSTDGVNTGVSTGNKLAILLNKELVDNQAGLASLLQSLRSQGLINTDSSLRLDSMSSYATLLQQCSSALKAQNLQQQCIIPTTTAKTTTLVSSTAKAIVQEESQKTTITSSVNQPSTEAPTTSIEHSSSGVTTSTLATSSSSTPAITSTTTTDHTTTTTTPDGVTITTTPDGTTSTTIITSPATTDGSTSATQQTTTKIITTTTKNGTTSTAVETSIATTTQEGVKTTSTTSSSTTPQISTSKSPDGTTSTTIITSPATTDGSTSATQQTTTKIITTTTKNGTTSTAVETSIATTTQEGVKTTSTTSSSTTTTQEGVKTTSTTSSITTTALDGTKTSTPQTTTIITTNPTTGKTEITTTSPAGTTSSTYLNRQLTSSSTTPATDAVATTTNPATTTAPQPTPIASTTANQIIEAAATISVSPQTTSNQTTTPQPNATAQGEGSNQNLALPLGLGLGLGLPSLCLLGCCLFYLRRRQKGTEADAVITLVQNVVRDQTTVTTKVEASTQTEPDNASTAAAAAAATAAAAEAERLRAAAEEERARVEEVANAREVVAKARAAAAEAAAAAAAAAATAATAEAATRAAAEERARASQAAAETARVAAAAEAEARVAARAAAEERARASQAAAETARVAAAAEAEARVAARDAAAAEAKERVAAAERLRAEADNRTKEALELTKVATRGTENATKMAIQLAERMATLGEQNTILRDQLSSTLQSQSLSSMSASPQRIPATVYSIPAPCEPSPNSLSRRLFAPLSHTSHFTSSHLGFSNSSNLAQNKHLIMLQDQCVIYDDSHATFVSSDKDIDHTAITILRQIQSQSGVPIALAAIKQEDGSYHLKNIVSVNNFNGAIVNSIANPDIDRIGNPLNTDDIFIGLSLDGGIIRKDKSKKTVLRQPATAAYVSNKSPLQPSGTPSRPFLQLEISSEREVV